MTASSETPGSPARESQPAGGSAPCSRACPCCESTSPPKPFGRFHDIVLLLLGFVLTSLLGNHVASLYQRRQWLEESRKELAQFNKATALQAYEETAELTDTLYVDAENLFRLFSRGKDLKAALERYETSYYRWQTRLQTLASKMELSFGPGVSRIFEIEIVGKYRFLDGHLRELVEAEELLPAEATVIVDTTLLEIRESSHHLGKQMPQILLSEEVDD